MPADENRKAWQLRGDSGLLLVCMPGGSLAIGAPGQPGATRAFSLEGPDGVKWIIGPPSDPYGDGYIRRSQVEVRASGLVAHTTATLVGDGPQNLAEFIADLAANWRGWAGDRRWKALEGEMETEASHDGRAHVRIAVTIRRPQVTFTQEAWSARIVLSLEAGEQLTSLARDLAHLLAG